MNIVINPAFNHLKEQIENIPASFTSEKNIIYEGRNTLKLIDFGGRKLVVKSFKIPNIINKFAYSYLRPSKARRSYEYGFEIIKRGINTPAPVAYIEEFKLGLLHRSFYICEYCNYDRSFREFDLRPGTFANKTDILIAFADFTAAMHDRQIYHPDYSNGNILFEKKGSSISFSVIDINRITFGAVSRKKSYKAFRRLCAGEEMLRIIAERYAVKRGLKVNECIAKVKYYNDKTMKPTPLDQWPPLEPQDIQEN